MRRIDLTYRLIKVGGKAVSVAICAMTGLMIAGSAMADTTLTTTAGTTFYSSTVTYVNNGVVVAGNGTVYGINDAGISSASRSSTVTNGTYGSLGVVNGYAGNTNYVLNSGVTVLDQTTGSNASVSTTSKTYNYTETMDSLSGSGIVNPNPDMNILSNKYAGSSDGLFNDGTATFSTGARLNAGVDYYYANSNGSLMGTGLDSVAPVDERFHDHLDSIDGSATFSAGSAAGVAGYAINTTGTVTMGGNNQINGSATANSITVNGSNVNFNGNVSVTNGLLFGSGGTAYLNGGSDLNGSVNFQGNTATLHLSDGSDVSGNITTSGNQKGTVYFEGNSHVSGAVGVGGTLQLLEADGASGTLVQIDGAVKAETLNVGAGTVALGSGIDTRHQDASLGAINFGNGDGIVQIGNTVTDVPNSANYVYGNVTTGADNKGTLTFIGANDNTNNTVVTGQIGASGAALKTLNIGAAGSTGIAGATGSANANVTINGNVYANSVKLNNDITGTTHDSVLTMGTGYNLTGTVTTAQNGMGVLTLQGGTQTVTGQVGQHNGLLATVNSGANGALSTFTTDVFATDVANSGTGTSVFKGNVYATNLKVDNGTTNVVGNIITDAGTASAIRIYGGTANLNVNVDASGNPTTGNNSASTTGNITFGGAGTANLYEGLTGTVDFASQDGTVNVKSGKTISGSVTNSGLTNNLGTLTLEGGSQTLAGTIGANADSLKLINAGANGATTTFSNMTQRVFAQTLNVTGTDGTGVVNLNNGLNGALVYQGNATVNVGANGITGTVTTAGADNTGTLKFTNAGGTQSVDSQIGTGAKGLKQIQMNGTGTAQINETFAHNVDFAQSGTVELLATRTLDTRTGSTNGTITFNATTGTFKADDNTIVRANITSTGGANNGTVTFTNSSILNGDIGTWTTHTADVPPSANVATNGLDGAATVNVGTAAQGTVSANGNVLATTVNIANSSTLVLASDKSLTGNVVNSSGTNNQGTLTLSGGIQTVTGNVGTNGATGSLSTVNAAAASAVSTFTGDVYANTINLVSGTANFNASGNPLVATASVTKGAIVFGGAGIANLYQGTAAGSTIDFNNYAGTVNVWDGKTLGAGGPNGISIGSTAGATSGIVNFRGAGTITGFVGIFGNSGVSQLNVNTVGAASGAIVNANNSVYAGVVNLRNSGELLLSSANTVLVGTTATSYTGAQQVVATDTNNTGTLTLQNGGHVVVGVVGANGLALAAVNAGDPAGIDFFDNMVYATKLNVGAGGTVVLGGRAGLKADGTAGTSLNSTVAGIKGTVDFLANGNASTLQIGDAVNLTTGATGTQFANANGSTLTFNGTSTVSGVVGGNTTGFSTFKTINAGAQGRTVTFANDVSVGSGNLHVTATTSAVDPIANANVKLQGNLTGNLVFDHDGAATVADGRSISGTVTTATTNQGTLTYLGGTTLNADIGSITGPKLLKAVTFNSGTNANVTQDIGHNVYASTVTIGGGSTTALSLKDTGVNFDFTGGSQTEKVWTGGTTANMTADVTLGGNVVIANATTAVNMGTSHVTVGNNLNTNNGALSFTVDTNDIAAGGAISAPATSGKITVGGTLTMTGNEKVQVTYVGSLHNAGTYNLISAAAQAGVYHGTEANGLVTDNSKLIATSVDLVGNNLVVTADRTGGGAWVPSQLYANMSNTVGHFSNNAAAVLAGIAATGTQPATTGGKPSDSLAGVIQALEFDPNGYNATAATLATQVKRLAPIANASLTQATFGSTTLTTNTVFGRLGGLRGDTLASVDGGTGISAGDAAKTDGFWLKGFGSAATQNASGAYDGYKSNTYGMALGADHRVDRDGLLGLAVSYATTNVDQQDFRLGDSTKVKSFQVTGYGSYDVSKELYVEGALSYANNKYDGNRAAVLGQTANASYSGKQWMARVGAGYRIALEGKSVFTPLASLEFSRLNTAAYTETGAGATNLMVDSLSVNRTRLGLGGRLSTEVESGNTIYRPEISAMWYHDAGALTKDTTASYTGGGSSFTTPGADVARNTFNVGGGVSIMTGKDSSVLVRYDYDGHSGFHAHTGQVTGRWAF